jgi:small redox-active disulfide protein 2
MGLFGKKKEKENSCSCGGQCGSGEISDLENKKTGNSVVKILGSGCKKCNELEVNTIEALKQLGMDTSVDHVTDFSQIAAYGVMSTPALVFNEKVVSYGKVLKSEEIAKMLKNLVV